MGYGAQVVFDLETPHGVYYNNPEPWATLQSVLRPTNPFYIELPDDYVPHQFDPELLRKYLPYAAARNSARARRRRDRDRQRLSPKPTDCRCAAMSPGPAVESASARSSRTCASSAWRRR